MSDNNSEACLVDFKVDFDLRAVTVKVIASRLVLVPAYRCAGHFESTTLDDLTRPTTKGKRIGNLSVNTFGIQDITAADDLIMILDRNFTVFVFTESKSNAGNCYFTVKEANSKVALTLTWSKTTA